VNPECPPTRAGSSSHTTSWRRTSSASGRATSGYPPDPHRFEKPHDILAAEEFAIPAGGERHESANGSKRHVLVPLLALAALAAFVAVRSRG
jgi:hypothetical protein